MKFNIQLKVFKIVSDFAKRNNEAEFAESAKQTAFHLTQWLGKIV